MGRPPMIPAERKVRIVLSILAGEMSRAKAALVAGKTGPPSGEEQMEAVVAVLTQALSEPAVELRVWTNSAEGRLGPSMTSR